jgi:hypothetical protein
MVVLFRLFTWIRLNTSIRLVDKAHFPFRISSEEIFFSTDLMITWHKYLYYGSYGLINENSHEDRVVSPDHRIFYSDVVFILSA